MSILDDEEKVMDSLGNLVIKEHIWRFIKNQMTDYSNENCNRFSSSAGQGLIMIKWMEVKGDPFDLNDYAKEFFGEFKTPSLRFRQPVERNQICSLSEVYETTDNRLLIVPRCPSWPMLLSHCYKIPDYVEFASPKEDLDIFTFQCSDEINHSVDKMRSEFHYNGPNINTLDRQILTTIYTNFGEYNSFNPKIIEFEKNLKEKLLFNIKK